MAIRCCYGCVAPKRYPGCHGHCPEYETEKMQYEEQKAAMRKAKDIEDGLTAQTLKAVNRADKKRCKRI